jgi:hypothetical protein
LKECTVETLIEETAWPAFTDVFIWKVNAHRTRATTLDVS